MPAIDNNTNLVFDPIRNKRRLKNLNNQRFGKLLVVGLLGRAATKTWWLCWCDCGNLSITMVSYLRGGETTSCGCVGPGHNHIHGMHGTKVHTAWCSMKQRCLDPNHPDYAVYSPRGVCELWKGSFEAFFADMGHPPSVSHSVERINNNLGYHCGHCTECLSQGWSLNCRWDTATKQARNRRSNVFLTYRNETRTIAEWAQILGVDYKAFWAHQKRLSDPELIFGPFLTQR